MLGLLANGGMAEVYLALSGDLHGFRTLVVVKRILPHLASNKDFIQMFFDEARILTLLDHPNIVRVIEVGQDRDEYFVAMDLVQGKPMSAVIRRAFKQGTPLSQAQAAYLVAQAANGLGYVHGLTDSAGLPLNIVHRDVSPQNILVSYDGAVKLIDFGVARLMGRTSVTQPGGLKGKIQYMAPEQASSGRVDRRSDVFALGVVLWEALCGRRPFRRDTEMEVLSAVVRENIPPPSKYVRVPARLESIVMRALERDPANRFQTAQEMALQLERYAFSSPEFNPTQIATVMKALFASDVARWRKTVSTVKNIEGEPDEWTNTSGTYLRPDGIDLTNRGSTLALRPVPDTPRALLSTQEVLSVAPSLPSIALESRPGKPPRRRAVVGGTAALGIVAVLMGLLALGRRHPAIAPRSPEGQPRPSAAAKPASSPMWVEALPSPTLQEPPAAAAAAAPEPATVDQAPLAVASAGVNPNSATAAGPAAEASVPPRSGSDPFMPAAPEQRAPARKRVAEPRRRRQPREVADPSARRLAADPSSSSSAAPQCLVRVGTKPWSEVWIDGRNTYVHTPYSRNIACGRHTLTFKRPDLHLTRTVEITAVAGHTLIQAFSLDGG